MEDILAYGAMGYLGMHQRRGKGHGGNGTPRLPKPPRNRIPEIVGVAVFYMGLSFFFGFKDALITLFMIGLVYILATRK